MTNWITPGAAILLLLLLATNIAPLLYTELRPATHADSTPTATTLNNYRDLLRQRPTWAPYWAGLVQEKRSLWQYDQEMQQAIRNSVSYGPWFASVQRIVLIAGFDGWPFLEKPTQKAVEDTLLRALQQRPQATISLAMDRGFLSYLLPLIQQNTGLETIYQKELQRRKRLLTAHTGNHND